MAKQYQTLHRKYEAPGKPTHKDGVWHCPACNSRVQINHTHCHRCGKKIGCVEWVGAALIQTLNSLTG